MCEKGVPNGSVKQRIMVYRKQEKMKKRESSVFIKDSKRKKNEAGVYREKKWRGTERLEEKGGTWKC